MQQARLVVLRACGNRPEADLVKSLLEAAGIQAMIQADTAGGMREHMAWSGAGFKVLVREEDATAAGEVLSGTLVNEGDGTDFQTERDPLPPWRRFT